MSFVLADAIENAMMLRRAHRFPDDQVVTLTVPLSPETGQQMQAAWATLHEHYIELDWHLWDEANWRTPEGYGA